MSISPLKSSRAVELITALGVVASLVFVGVEIRQNTVATEGATLQSISDTHTQLLLESVWDADFIRVYSGVFEGRTRADFDAEDNMRLTRYYIAFLSHLENTYLQYHAGAVDETVFESYGWRFPLWRTAHFRETAGLVLGLGVSPEFASFFRSRTQEP